LRASVARNGFDKVRVVQAVVDEKPGSIQFISHGPWGHVAPEGTTSETVTVPAVRAGHLLGGLGWERVAFVKVDVEGSEIKAIRGLSGLLEGPSSPPIVYESNSHTLRFYGLTPADLLGELERFGYRSYLLEPGRLLETPSTELQPQTVVNFLAVKGGPPDIPGWKAEGPMTPEEKISKLVAESQFQHEDHRANVGWTLKDAPVDMLADPQIVKTLERLSKDSAESVRRAVRWWQETGTGTPA
jgi:FkbM family methyltransferase